MPSYSTFSAAGKPELVMGADQPSSNMVARGRLVPSRPGRQHGFRVTCCPLRRYLPYFPYLRAPARDRKRRVCAGYQVGRRNNRSNSGMVQRQHFRRWQEPGGWGGAGDSQRAPSAELVKSRTSAGICRNLNRILCFHDAHGLSEIGFVRRILPISPVPLSSSACFSTPSGQLKGTPTRASQAVMPETYWAHTWHSGHASARAKYAEYVPRMRFDDGITRPTHHSCRIATTALGPAAVLTLASATSAVIGRTA